MNYAPMPDCGTNEVEQGSFRAEKKGAEVSTSTLEVPGSARQTGVCTSEVPGYARAREAEPQPQLCRASRRHGESFIFHIGFQVQKKGA